MDEFGWFPNVRIVTGYIPITTTWAYVSSKRKFENTECALHHYDVSREEKKTVYDSKTVELITLLRENVEFA